MKNLKNFVKRFEGLAQDRQLYLERENISEERIVAYNDLGRTEQYVFEKEKSFGDTSKIEEIGENGVGGRTAFVSEVEVMSFRSKYSMNWHDRDYFIRFFMNNGIDYHEHISNRLNLEDNILSIDMSIFQKNSSHDFNPGKIKNIFNVHYGVFGGKVISKDIHHKKPFLIANKTGLNLFLEIDDSMYKDGNDFRFSLNLNNLSGFDEKNFVGHYKKEDFYKNCGVSKNVSSKLIFPGLKKRDIANPYQGMDLFFDVVDKIKEKSN